MCVCRYICAFVFVRWSVCVCVCVRVSVIVPIYVRLRMCVYVCVPAIRECVCVRAC